MCASPNNKKPESVTRNIGLPCRPGRVGASTAFRHSPTKPEPLTPYALSTELPTLEPHIPSLPGTNARGGAVLPRPTTPEVHQTSTITSAGLETLVKLLAEDGYTVVGPTVRNQQLVLDEIRALSDLPVGWTDDQSPGSYRLGRSESRHMFDCLTGAQSWKQFLFPARQTLWSATRARSNGSVEFRTAEHARQRFAFLGVRACDLAAIAIQDRVFVGGKYPDPVYACRRESAFVIAVNCTRSGATCFCASMGTGPRANSGFDLALTEMSGQREPVFAVETGTPRGAEFLQRIETAPVDSKTLAVLDSLHTRAATQQVRSIDPETACQSLIDHLGSSHWQITAERCLACGNCTMVCPTCFCSTVEDTTDLSGATAERQQVWDSCFHLDHSYIHGGSVRKSTAARYRQWITHKLATWYDQFGTAGCVGCGRCITWCPVGIDITEEIEAISPVTPVAGAPRNQATRKVR